MAVSAYSNADIMLLHQEKGSFDHVAVKDGGTSAVFPIEEVDDLCHARVGDRADSGTRSCSGSSC